MPTTTATGPVASARTSCIQGLKTRPRSHKSWTRCRGLVNGQYEDAESGLYYLRARYYDPGTATFLTRDPAEALTDSAYDYTAGAPLDSSDPAGLYTQQQQDVWEQLLHNYWANVTNNLLPALKDSVNEHLHVFKIPIPFTQHYDCKERSAILQFAEIYFHEKAFELGAEYWSHLGDNDANQLAIDNFMAPAGALNKYIQGKAGIAVIARGVLENLASGLIEHQIEDAGQKALEEAAAG